MCVRAPFASVCDTESQLCEVRSCDVSREPKQRSTGHQIGLPEKRNDGRGKGSIFSVASAATREMRFAPQSSVSVSKAEEK